MTRSDRHQTLRDTLARAIRQYRSAGRFLPEPRHTQVKQAMTRAAHALSQLEARESRSTLNNPHFRRSAVNDGFKRKNARDAKYRGASEYGLGIRNDRY